MTNWNELCNFQLKPAPLCSTSAQHLMTQFIFSLRIRHPGKTQRALRVFTLSQLEFKCRSNAREKNGTCSNSDLRCSCTLETEESFAHLSYLPGLGAFGKAGLFSAAYLIVFWPTSL